MLHKLRELQAIVDPIAARRMRLTGIIRIHGNEDEGDTTLRSRGRLGGFLPMRFPANVRGWSKMRLFIIEKFSEELQGMQIVLGSLVVALLLCMVLLLVFLFMSPEQLHAAGIIDNLPGPKVSVDQSGIWKIKVCSLARESIAFV